MKIIFLDIDGVLNSAAYDRQRTIDDGNIDKTRLVLIKTLIDKTNAKIVLTSSWRVHWDKNPEKCDEKGHEISETLKEIGLEIYDKTPNIGYLERAEEIRYWLSSNRDVENFVIFDDNVFGWGNLSDKLIQTKYSIGRGLEKQHIHQAFIILGECPEYDGELEDDKGKG